MKALFHLDPDLLTTPAAQAAQRAGLLQAKREALKSAERLVRIGRPLLYATLGVSGIHLVHQLGAIVPTGVAPLAIPASIFHVSTILTMLSIDAVATYLISAKNVTAYAGAGQTTRMQYFHLVLTAVVNLAFLLTYAPGLPAFVAPVLPLLALISAVMIGLLVPVSIVAVEHAHQVANAARLALLVETTTLAGIVDAQVEQPQDIVSLPVTPKTADLDVPGTTDLLAGNTTTPEPARDRTCRHCGATGLTQVELMQHGRRHAQERKRNRRTNGVHAE